MTHTLPPFPLIDRDSQPCLFVDNSMLELLTTCPRALEYNKLHQRVSAASKPSLSFGGAIHAALEYRYKTFQGRAVDPYGSEGIAAILSDYMSDKVVPQDDWRNLNWAITLMERYNAQYGLEDFNLLRYKTPIKCPHCAGKGCRYCTDSGESQYMVELPFTLPLYVHTIHGDEPGFPEPKEITVMYSGRIDLPILLSDGLFVMDHKTTSMLGQQFQERSVTLAQQYGYCWAFEQLTGQKVIGFVINAIRTKEPPLYINDPLKAVPKGQSPDKWWRESFARQRHYATSERINAWKNNTIELVEEFFWHYSRGFMPQKTAWCCQFGRCQYYDVCWEVPPQQALQMLQSSIYTDNKWSPLAEPSDSLQ